jgi:hypothetical protein
MTPRARWLLIIIGFLVANALAMGFLVMASSSHPVDIHPDYYKTLSR